MSFPFLSIIVPFALFCFFYMKHTKKKLGQKTEEFFQKEREANSVRKQPLSDLVYINVDLSRIPFIETDNENLKESLNILKTLSTQKIVNLSGITNTDLKLKYGVANLPELTEYDQNYTTLCRTLLNTGKEYLALGDTNSAKRVLEYGIECNTDLKSHYLLLADIYESESDYEKIMWLISQAENMNSMLKSSLIRDLKDKIDLTAATKKVLEDISLNNSLNNIS